MSRTFRLGDRWNADLRFGDAVNALNDVTYPSWVTTITNEQFGMASANAMRRIQTTFRLRF